MESGRLISVIDDDDSMRRAVVALVRSAGYDARGYESAEEFLETMDTLAFGCIVTDIQMPGLSGIQLKHHLTARQNRTPVIMITAREDPSLEQQALASGAVCFLRKPFQAEEFVACLEKALQA